MLNDWLNRLVAKKLFNHNIKEREEDEESSPSIMQYIEDKRKKNFKNKNDYFMEKQSLRKHLPEKESWMKLEQAQINHITESKPASIILDREKERIRSTPVSLIFDKEKPSAQSKAPTIIINRENQQKIIFEESSNPELPRTIIIESLNSINNLYID